MAAVNAPTTTNKYGVAAWMLSGLILFTLAFVVWEVLVLEGLVVTSGLATYDNSDNINSDNDSDSDKPFAGHKIEEARLRSERVNREHRPGMMAALFDESQWEEHNKVNALIKKITPNACGYDKGLFGMREEELHPVAGKRHMITPPDGGKLSMVCCETTKGNLAIVVHHKWAPIGAAHFIELVKAAYFDSTVPMMRCLKDFLCQFGLNSNPMITKKFRGELKDDPNWLPEGPKYRENDQGVLRFARGYLAYAGAGPNTRGNQFIVSLKASGPLAGGSPWEVPWGELVGEESYETLSQIYTGYDEEGPTQGKLQNRGMDEELKKEFPDLDYINGCVLVDERES